MNAAEATTMAARGELYPGLILHGASRTERVELAVLLGQTLLCAEPQELRACGRCRHCRRILAPEPGSMSFHPDFFLVERDLRTVTSVEAVKTVLRSAQMRPFEARGQVFVLADAETLAPSAADALLKNLEEPAATAPRHFLLLAPSAVELQPTLRSRCLPIYLGTGSLAGDDELAARLGPLDAAIEGYAGSGSASYLIAAAAILHQASSWDDSRSARPWSRSAWLVLETAKKAPSGALRSGLLAVSEALLDGIELRVRNVPPQRILEGALARHLYGR